MFIKYNVVYGNTSVSLVYFFFIESQKHFQEYVNWKILKAQEKANTFLLILNYHRLFRWLPFSSLSLSQSPSALLYIHIITMVLCLYNVSCECIFFSFFFSFRPYNKTHFKIAVKLFIGCGSIYMLYTSVIFSMNFFLFVVEFRNLFR